MGNGWVRLEPCLCAVEMKFKSWTPGNRWKNDVPKNRDLWKLNIATKNTPPQKEAGFQPWFVRGYEKLRRCTKPNNWRLLATQWNKSSTRTAILKCCHVRSKENGTQNLLGPSCLRRTFFLGKSIPPKMRPGGRLLFRIAHRCLHPTIHCRKHHHCPSRAATKVRVMRYFNYAEN